MRNTERQTTNTQRFEILQRLRGLEEQIATVQAQAAAHAAGERLPSSCLMLEAAEHRALVPVAQVLEVVRLVATAALPGAPEAVVGTFLHRGHSVLAIDLARWLGVAREPSVDAHLVVFGASRPFALVVDRVSSVVDRPEILDSTERLPDAWRGTGAVAALCLTPAGIAPLLRLNRFVEVAEELVG